MCKLGFVNILNMNYIIDTSIIAAGDNSLFKNAEKNLKLIGKLKYTNPRKKFFLTPGVINEINNFTGSAFKDTIEKIFQIETVNLYNCQLPAKLFCTILNELRERNRRLLKHTESLISSDKPTDQKVGGLRDLFRQTLYSGVLDSGTDIEIALLARKKRGVLLTKDEGLSKFGREIGVQVSDKF